MQFRCESDLMPWSLSEPIRIVVMGAPKAWERSGLRLVSPRGRKPFISSYTPAQTRHEEARIKALAFKAMSGRSPLTGAVELRFVAHMPIPPSWSKRKQAAALADQIRPTPKPDLSNLIKLCEDAMNKTVFLDDSQITDGGIFKRYSAAPRLVIEIRSLTWIDQA